MEKQLFSAKNLKILGISFVLLVVGYFLLGRGPVDNPLSMTIAPLILVGTYGIVIPLSIVFGMKKEDKPDSNNKSKGV